MREAMLIKKEAIMGCPPLSPISLTPERNTRSGMTLISVIDDSTRLSN